jgi:hypothetical protein
MNIIKTYALVVENARNHQLPLKEKHETLKFPVHWMGDASLKYLFIAQTLMTIVEMKNTYYFPES